MLSALGNGQDGIYLGESRLRYSYKVNKYSYNLFHTSEAYLPPVSDVSNKLCEYESHAYTGACEFLDTLYIFQSCLYLNVINVPPCIR